MSLERTRQQSPTINQTNRQLKQKLADVIQRADEMDMAPDDIAEEELTDQSAADQKAKSVESDRKADALTALKGHKVKMMLRTGNKLSALIGDRLVHEGDFTDGHWIVSILPKGIRVEPVSDE